MKIHISKKISMKRQCLKLKAHRIVTKSQDWSLKHAGKSYSKTTMLSRKSERVATVKSTMLNVDRLPEKLPLNTSMGSLITSMAS